MVSPAPRSLSKPTGSRVLFLVVLRWSKEARELSGQTPQ